VTGLDGKTYAPRPPAPQPSPLESTAEPDSEAAPEAPAYEYQLAPGDVEEDDEPDAALAVEAYVAADPNLAKVTWNSAYFAAIRRITAITSFTVDQVVRQARPDVIDELHRAQDDLARYVREVDAAMPRGLSVVSGGRS
jgi:hypothetical protein